MKKFLIALVAVAALTGTANAQKFALVDMEYILKAIPAYESANEQLNLLSTKWQKEIEIKLTEVQTMYKNYQTELVFLSAEMKKNREDDILAREKEANDLKRKYFGAEGELFQKRESLIKPIQEEIYNAIQTVSNRENYQMILDKTSTAGLIFASPKIDISELILSELGYSK
ncbi:MAG: OmpH family outer membrane protein [Prevotellaceae bacterium]|jgi:outer membrane protein|nr:OmpH family outer membrane protein [Prevotellaceae bacterium]